MIEGMIVITARNNLSLTKACYESATYQCPARDRRLPGVMLFDNASTDATAAWTKTLYGVRKISLRNAISVATMWNTALNWCWLQGYREALVVNNDTVLQPDMYKLLQEHMDRTGAGLVSGVSVGEEGWAGMSDSWKDRTQQLQAGQISESPHPDFSGFMIAAWAHKRVRFDESYEVAYAEDAQWHVEAHRAGIRAVSINVPFLHRRSSTIRTASPEEAQQIAAAAERNRQRFYERYGCVPGTKRYEELFRA